MHLLRPVCFNMVLRPNESGRLAPHAPIWSMAILVQGFDSLCGAPSFQVYIVLFVYAVKHSAAVIWLVTGGECLTNRIDEQRNVDFCFSPQQSPKGCLDMRIDSHPAL